MAIENSQLDVGFSMFSEIKYLFSRWFRFKWMLMDVNGDLTT